jgi:hypothetical protein
MFVENHFFIARPPRIEKTRLDGLQPELFSWFSQSWPPQFSSWFPFFITTTTCKKHIEPFSTNNYHFTISSKILLAVNFSCPKHSTTFHS